MEQEITIDGIKLKLVASELNLRRGAYYISENGDIYSMLVKRFLRPKVNEDGYKMVQLRRDGNNFFTTQVARLVLFTFKGAPPLTMHNPSVDHIDGIRTNNNISNLRWLEQGVNSSVRKNKGTGENNPKARLTENDVHQICKLLEETNLSCTEIGRMFHVTSGAICCIKNHRNWTYISNQYNW